MNEQFNRIRNRLEQLIDELELTKFKVDLLDNLKFTYRLMSYSDEDYSRLGNTRLGGLPDLPKNIEYPYNEHGYYNLLCQINFSEFRVRLDGMPEKGILYIFNGHSSDNDSITIFTESTDNLVRKSPPPGIINLNNENREFPYDGIKAVFDVGYYFDCNTSEIYNHNEGKYHSLMGSNKFNETFIFGKAADACSIYSYLKGFDTLMHEVLLYSGIRDDYQSQLETYLKECEEAILQKSENIEYFRRKKEQLQKLDSEKEIHFANYENVTCIIGLESLERLGWMWGDMGSKNVYILDEDLEKGNFNNLYVETYSS